MAVERSDSGPLNPDYPPEMAALIGTFPIDQQVLPKNSEIDTAALLIRFYRDKPHGVLQAYKDHIQAPVNIVISNHNRLHDQDQRHPRGITYVMPSVPYFIAAIKTAIERGVEDPLELAGLEERRRNLESVMGNKANQIGHTVPFEQRQSDPPKTLIEVQQHAA